MFTGLYWLVRASWTLDGVCVGLSDVCSELKVDSAFGGPKVVGDSEHNRVRYDHAPLSIAYAWPQQLREHSAHKCTHNVPLVLCISACVKLHENTQDPHTNTYDMHECTCLPSKAKRSCTSLMCTHEACTSARIIKHGKAHVCNVKMPRLITP